MMDKIVLPFTEIANNLPSVAVFANGRSGVLSQMSSVPVPFTSNGFTLDNLSDISCVRHRDPLDALGAATKQMFEDMHVYKKSSFATAFSQAIQKRK